MNSSNLALKKIYDQFRRETEVLSDHIEFMEKSVVLNGLKENKWSYKASIHNLDDYDIKSIQNKITELNQKNVHDISTLQNKIKNSNLYVIPQWLESVDSRSDEGEFINYLLELLDSDITDREKIFNEVQGQLEVLCVTKGDNIGGDFYNDLYDNSDKINEYIDNALKIYYNNSIYNDQKELETLKNYQKLLRLIDKKNNINIYRQAFIQLIALFDALVFECCKIQFNENFFQWLKLFDNDNVKLHDIASNNNFDELKNMIIEKNLKVYT